MSASQEREDESPSCKCFVTDERTPCPIHGLDRSQTTRHPSRQPRDSGRVINTTESLKRG